MKHLKKSPAILLLMLLTVIIGSWTFPQKFSRWADQAKQPNRGVVSATVNTVEPGATNIMYQSIDGGITWQDISQGLPEQTQPADFFAGASELYLRVHDDLYRSKSNLEKPAWEKENAPNSESTSIAFNRSGVMAFNYEGKFFQKTSSGKWLRVYTNFKKHLVRTVFEASDGTLFIGSDFGLFKSVDKGQSWKNVHNEGWVMDLVESKGVLIGTGQKGIMRSTDYGEHWEWVISEGGVGIAIERIDGGFAAITYNSNMQSRRIRLSKDDGKTWTAIDNGLPPSMNISSIKQVGNFLLCGHPDGIFRSSDMGKTWKLVHPGADSALTLSAHTRNLFPIDDNRRVYKLFVSNGIAYAVLRNAGC